MEKEPKLRTIVKALRNLLQLELTLLRNAARHLPRILRNKKIISGNLWMAFATSCHLSQAVLLSGMNFCFCLKSGDDA